MKRKNTVEKNEEVADTLWEAYRALILTRKQIQSKKQAQVVTDGDDLAQKKCKANLWCAVWKAFEAGKQPTEIIKQFNQSMYTHTLS